MSAIWRLTAATLAMLALAWGSGRQLSVVRASGNGGDYGYPSSSSSPAAKAAPKQARKAVTIKETDEKYHFLPARLTVKAGAKVVWKNGTDAPHTITSNSSGMFDKSISPGATVTLTFKKAGTYTYHCSIHPYMHGTIVVR